MNAHEGKQRRIAFFGHFNLTNFGNESTLQAVLYNLRCYEPEAEITCITTGPEVAKATHKINAIPVAESFVKSWRPRNPLLKVMRRLFVGIPSEPWRWVKGVSSLRHTDMLIIPGTGLLSDAYGLFDWGPYTLFKWSLIAKICRCKLLFVSVGAGPIHGVLGRWLIKSALSLADFRSYRDNSTKQYLKSVGFRVDNDRVYPDLVFSLPESLIAHRGDKNQRTTVGLGLMVDAGKYGTSRGDNHIYNGYLATLVNFAEWSLARGDDIRLLIGDMADIPTRHEFRHLLSERLSERAEEHIIDEPVSSPEDLLPQIEATDIVVATRFHNVLLALLCCKPVIAISFHQKCDSLMSAMGLSAYCLDINSLKDDTLIEKFCHLEANAEELKVRIRKKVGEFRSALDEQYMHIFGSSTARVRCVPDGPQAGV
jgi:polysaccharide pyruvyl transferase WcaK-like protein